MGYHTTVLLHHGVDALITDLEGIYVDVTFGGGGHSRELLSRLSENGRLIAFDQDADAFRNEWDDPRFSLKAGNFRFLENFLQAEGIDQIDGLLADLGVSGHHFDQAERGFSFRFDAPLDMRMNQNQGLDARTVVNEYEESDLREVFWRYGETNYGRKLASRIVEQRKEKAIETTSDLEAVVSKLVPPHKSKAEITKVFQAIRIEVNDELGALEVLLESATKVLKPGGKLVVMSYHSLEDRLVKRFIRSGNFDDIQEKDVFGNIIRPLTPDGKVVVPSKEEIEQNPRARSAKMRVAIKN